MVIKLIAAFSIFLFLFVSLADKPGDNLKFPGEVRLENIRQLTFGGENAEAYFSFGGRQLVFQSTRDGRSCDQIYVMDLNAGDAGARMVSTGRGRTTCGFFLPGDERVIYSSTHLAGPDCPPRPDLSRGYVWPLYSSYDIFSVRLDGSGLLRLTDSQGYDAEATVAPDGRIAFASTRDGDIDIYTMDRNGKNVKRLTYDLGYDGGPFFSYDGSRIVYRAHHPADKQEIARYKELLAQGLVEPSRLEIFVMDADGSNRRQLTANGAANFAPCFHPDGRRIIFSSNLHDPRGRDFDLYMIDIDGRNLERITYNDTFDSFPMFSRDGRHLAFASNRNARSRGETNIFIADWVER